MYLILVCVCNAKKQTHKLDYKLRNDSPTYTGCLGYQIMDVSGPTVPTEDDLQYTKASLLKVQIAWQQYARFSIFKNLVICISNEMHPHKYRFKVIRFVFGFRIEFIENKDIWIFL